MFKGIKTLANGLMNAVQPIGAMIEVANTAIEGFATEYEKDRTLTVQENQLERNDRAHAIQLQAKLQKDQQLLRTAENDETGLKLRQKAYAIMLRSASQEIELKKSAALVQYASGKITKVQLAAVLVECTNRLKELNSHHVPEEESTDMFSDFDNMMAS